MYTFHFFNFLIALENSFICPFETTICARSIDFITNNNNNSNTNNYNNNNYNNNNNNNSNKTKHQGTKN
jgi:hypothetical protein